MAPSLVETTTTTEVDTSTTRKLHLGQYKEIDLTYIDKDTEAGKNGHAAAKVSYSSALFCRQSIVKSTDLQMKLGHSIPTTFQPGTPSNNTLP